MNLKFAKEEDVQDVATEGYWKLLIADDELEVHNITKSVLKKFTFKNKKLKFFSAYSKTETIDILKNNSDIDVVLLDVVMETDDAGLLAVKAIREELNNHNVRIVLRTGQPGFAPEKQVIVDYDIDDYKEKTELTSTKLFTTIVSSLRTSHHIKTIKKNQAALEKIIDASKTIFKMRSLADFAKHTLAQLVLILDLIAPSSKQKRGNGYFAILENDIFRFLSGIGRFENKELGEVISCETVTYLKKAFKSKKSFFEDDVYVGFIESANSDCIFLYLEDCKDLSEELSKADKNFLHIFANNISIAFENICLNSEMFDTQKEIIERLGSIVESRSKEAACHIYRVANISYVLAKAYGMSEDEANKLRLASPMHDIGKIGIPDSILLKPAKLNKDEYEIIKTHTDIGRDILDGSNRDLLKLAKIVAYEHHERWDGKGYPRGLKREETSIYGRITAIADVFDALTQKRIYKEPWEIDKALDYFKQERGKQFDPVLVDLLLENIDKIKEISKKCNT
jgi:response regulator RpfG family c-di-GMP phosphodiesterase